MTDAAATPSGATPRTIRLALIASLALNLLVLGAFAGHFLFAKEHRHGRGAMRGEDFGLMGFTRTLPAERRKELNKAIAEGRAKLRPMLDKVADERRSAADLLAAEPYDGAAFRAAMERIADAERESKAGGLAILIEAANSLETEERKSLAQWWRKRNASRKERMHDRIDEGKPSKE